MPSITAEDVVRLFEGDVRARRRLAELLVGEPDVRLAIVNAVLREVATKQDIERLREELRRELREEIENLRKEFREEIEKVWREIEKLREDVRGLGDRVSRLEGRLDVLVKAFIAFNIPLLTAVIGILLKMVLTP